MVIVTDSASPLSTVSILRRLGDAVAGTLPVGGAILQHALKNAVLLRFYRSTCRRPTGFGHFQHRRGTKGSVHQLLKADHITSSHRANVFMTKEEVLYLREIVWQCVKFWELWEKSTTGSKTTHESCNFPARSKNSALEVLSPAVTSLISIEMCSVS